MHLITLGKAAEMLRLSKARLRQLHRTGDLTCIVLEGCGDYRVRVFDYDEIARLADRRRRLGWKRSAKWLSNCALPDTAAL